MDLSSATKNLIYIDPFYGHIALGLPKYFGTDVPTACAKIVGINVELEFNPTFWEKLNDKQRIGLVQHELGHVCLFHLIHFLDYDDKEVFNIAADITINQYIGSDYLPPGGVLPSTFPELKLESFKDTKYYYDKLMEDVNNNHSSQKLQKLVEHMKGGNMTVCSHPHWGKGDPSLGEDQEGSGGGPKMMSDAIRDLVKAQIEHQIKETYEECLSKNPGSVPGYLRDMVLGLYMKKPPVLDWRVVMRQFKSYCDRLRIAFTRNRPNKRFPDFDAVTLRQEQKMLVGLDTSGSISGEQLCDFFTQVGHMAKAGVQIDVCEWDYGIQRIYRFDPQNPWKAGKTKGGGGTDPTEVVQKLNKDKNYNAMIMFSDGYIGGSWGNKPSKPILWIITKDGSTNFNMPGKKIKVQI